MNRECGRWRLRRGRLAGFARARCDFNTYRKASLIGLEELLLRHAVDLPGGDWTARVRGFGRDDDSSAAERSLGKGRGRRRGSRRDRA